MAAPGGGDKDPPPPISDEDAFRRLIASGGKRKASLSVPKFIKNLEEIPEIALPETQSVKIALALSERGLLASSWDYGPQQKQQMIGSKETGSPTSKKESHVTH